MLAIMKLFNFVVVTWISVFGVIFSADCEISWTERSNRNLPSATVLLTINGEIHKLENTASDSSGLISKDGKYCIYSVSYDSNDDGITDFHDNSKIKIVKILDNKIEVVKEILNATGMFDINSDSTKFVYIGVNAKGMYLNKINLIDNTESIIINSAKWLGHVSISANDKWCAFYISHDKLNNQIVVAGQNDSRVISGNVGNGWAMTWVGNILMFNENDLKNVVYYDPQKNIRVSKNLIVNEVMFNKRKSGWPNVGLLKP
jgi:hypothetical protein